MFRAIFELLKKENLYRIYCILIVAAGIKQMVDISVLVDWGEYHAAAVNLLQDQNLDTTTSEINPEHWLHLTRRTLGFPLLIIVSFCSPYAMVVLQLLPAFLVPIWSKKLSETMALPEPTFRKFLMLLLLYPLQFFYAVLPMPEIWCQLLVLIATFCFLQKKWMAMAGSVVALVLLKPVFIILAMAVFIYALFALKLRYWLLAPAIVIALISAWNYQLTDRFHYTSIGVENTWEYNQRAVLNVVMTGDERDHYFNKSDSIFRLSSFAEIYDFMRRESSKNISTHWKLYTWLHLKGALLATVDPGRYDLIAFLKLPEGTGFMGAKKEGGFIEKIAAQPLPVLLYMVLFMFANILRWMLAAFALLRSFRKWILLFVFVLVFVGITGPVGSARYLFPFIPLICLMASHGWQLWLSKNEKNIVA